MLARTFRASRYAERMCAAHPALIADLRDGSGMPLAASAML